MNQECLEWIIDNLESRLVRDGDQWCFASGDSSGRDFYKYIPIQYLEDDRIDSLAEEVWDDFDFEGYADDFDYDTFFDIFDEAFDTLVDQNLNQ